MMLKVITPGLLTTIQDAGRNGYQDSGFSVSGCMDRRAMLEANGLVNNDINEAVLEMQYLGGTFRFEGETYFALTGADMAPLLNGRTVPGYRAVKVHKGDILECRRANNGRFAYLAVAGGFAIEPVLGSKSTNLKCGIGGFEGRALLAGDELPMNCETTWLLNEYLKEAEAPVYKDKICLRVTAGPQEHKFTPKGLDDFYSREYLVTEQSDRMGYRMDGAPVESENGVDIISDGIVEGAIQVTPGGMPMILLADRQTTGGYAKIGTVIAADIPSLVQCMPGAKVHFKKISLEEAVSLYRKEEKDRKKFLKSVGYCKENQGMFERKVNQWKGMQRK